ncbi:MAG: hypothetical protein VXZ72_04330 [Chlamydiota bacterium]|nr:hypothetical protein [Chlamydiota bacterium]
MRHSSFQCIIGFCLVISLLWGSSHPLYAEEDFDAYVWHEDALETQDDDSIGLSMLGWGIFLAVGVGLICGLVKQSPAPPPPTTPAVPVTPTPSS